MFYFFYFALVGGIAPYLPVYLKGTGYGAAEVGQLMSIIMLTKLAAPNFWGWVADKTGRQLALIRFGSLAAAIFFLGFLLFHGFWWHALFLVLFSCFWNAVLPQWEVITLHNLGAERSQYSRIRLWGSVGFIASVSVLGLFFDYFTIQWLPYWLLFFLCGIFLTSWVVAHQPGKQGHGSFRKFLHAAGRPEVVVFFITAFLVQLSFGPYYTFLSIYLSNLGYDMVTIGALWGLGVLAEVLLFVKMHALIERFSLRSIMLICLLLTTFRWFGIAFGATSALMLIALQLLHAASFGGLHASSIEMVHRCFKQEHASQAQAMYSAVSFGAGGSLGAFASGMLAEQFNISLAFIVAGVVSAVATALLLVAWPRLNQFWR
ncbi:MFS transporter [Hahella ganghwensis]|uniref:MFS transporter n=1 Tax=Hahella ganghwensis TaxID=286420 RepID=UPI000A067AF4|nr:MFS transporter [Hahella ganghwensis]